MSTLKMLGVIAGAAAVTGATATVLVTAVEMPEAYRRGIVLALVIVVTLVIRGRMRAATTRT